MTLSKYGSFKSFCATFHPNNMMRFYEEQGIDRMLSTNVAPSLAIVKATYGLQETIGLISTFLLDCSIFYGNTRVTAQQFYGLAALIDTEAHYLKVTELMLFFYLMKSGRLRDRHGDDRGKMYGNFNGEVVMDCLYNFKQWRAAELERIEREENMKKLLQSENEEKVDASQYIAKIRESLMSKKVSS